MGKVNDTINSYLSDPVRYADVVNHGLFSGNDVIVPEYLDELDSVERNPDTQRARDLKKKYKNQAIFLIIGVENQENIHYAMALRGLIYDTLSYQEQLREIQKRHEEEQDLHGDEWLGRFGKDDKLIPVITLVLYYGNKPWDASMDLYGIMDIPEELKTYQSMMLNYKLNLLDVAGIHDLDTYSDDLKMVFGFVKYQRDKEALKKFVDENYDLFSKVPIETCKTIEVLTNAKEIIRYIKNSEDNKEVVNVCEALQGMREDAKIEGCIEGEVRKVIRQVLKKLQKGKDCAEIADALEEETAYVERIVAVINQHAPGYDEDAIYKELSKKRQITN